MQPSEEVVLDDTVLGEEGIEPFDWEDHQYESWLEEKLEKEKASRSSDLNSGGG